MARTGTLNTPPGAVAQVRIIDTTSRLRLVPLEFLMRPPMSGLPHMATLPSWSFLIESASGKKALFDLGVPKDFTELAPVVSNRLKTDGWDIKVEKTTADILVENGVSTTEINSIIWSHWHWDHLGNPSTFPSSTELVVGPGFREKFLPAHPAQEMSPMRQIDFDGRDLREIEFVGDSTLTIGQFRAVDFFGDGSFYLLDSPGHAVGHLAGLARTSLDPDTFIMMGGDLCHHGGELRPSNLLPLPREISPHPFRDAAKVSSVCPGSMFEDIQLARSRSIHEPFFDPAIGVDIPEAIRTIRKAQEADADDDVWFIFAHDDTLIDVVDFFPLSLNEWKRKGWGERTRWAFLKDFEGVVAQTRVA